MRWLRHITVLVVLTAPAMLFSTSPPVRAAGTYYVATNGNDSSGDGSIGTPWRTIGHAVSVVPDGSTVLVRPGTYTGRIDLEGNFPLGITIRSEVPYRAVLRNNDRVVTIYDGHGITLEGFDIAHSGTGSAALVVHIDGGGSNTVSRITIRNNVLHDSFNNDILKVNNAARDVLVQGNVFYNQNGSDEHIDVNSVENVTVEDNIFFNNFAGSGRTNTNSTSSFVVIKDSNAGDDIYTGSRAVTVRRNVFLNWEGSTGSNFVLVGEDGQPFFEAFNVLIENNLMLGNSSNVMRVPFGVKGGRDITFRNNTISGDTPSLAFAMRLNVEGSNPANQNIRFYNNIWSDPTGTMGGPGTNDFSDTPPAETTSFVLQNNLYWNGASSLPSDAGELINYTNDAARIVGDPRLQSASAIVLPRWVPASGMFADGSTSVRQAFVNMVTRYGRPATGSPAINSGNTSNSPAEDILGNSRQAPDVGACEFRPSGLDTDQDGIPDDVEIVEGTNPGVKDNDVFNNARLFVMQQYRDFLGREGDPGGIGFWTNQINSGANSRAQVIENFFNSGEFQNTTAPVTRLYFAYFRRIPDYGGLTFWVNQYRSGTPLSAISQSFAQSQEFIDTYGSLNNTQFVTLVYNNVLGRAPDPGGLAFWTGQLDSGAMSRGQVMLGFSESAEFKAAIFNEVYVTQIYIGMLRRSPDAGGFAFWVGSMDSGAPGIGLIGGFLGSAEYRARFLL
jgi:hypothetical protein